MAAMRPRRLARLLIFVLLICSVTYFTVSYTSLNRPHFIIHTPSDAPPRAGLYNPGDHPIRKLINGAQADFDNLVKKRSTSLEEAVKEYKRRYSIPPPPHFDKWWKFAKERDVVFVDEFDSIHHSLHPFWGLPPVVLRKRVAEACGHDNGLIGLQIRHGNVSHIEGGRIWMRAALKGMLEGFMEELPDMDLALNIHDEPRVVLQHEDLVELNRRADTAKGGLQRVAKLRHGWSNTPDDLTEGQGFKNSPITRFSSVPHQSTWQHSRSSCPPDSPARSLSEIKDVADYNIISIVSPVGFISNHTASSDICLHPSLSTTYGFFAGANTFRFTTDLVPIFSQSKLSSFQDIIYPSPWYWADKVPYVPDEDMKTWEEKESQVYWRGATTGGYSRFGNWRRQHRQRFVSFVNSNSPNSIKTLKKVEEEEEWKVDTSKQIKHFKDSFDVRFVEVGQADAGDVAAQKDMFRLVPKGKPGEVFAWKYLLDMDGNAFSGRFYSFLRSKSAVVKMAVSREWHDEWLKPWLHYIPISVQGNDWIETIRWYLDGTEGGGKSTMEGKKVAERGREWSNKVLRNEDLEVWFYRLLLEYARVVDDDRESIGFEL